MQWLNCFLLYPEQDVPNDKKWNTGQKQSQLNARSPTVPAPPGTLAMSTPKNKDSETLEGIERLLPNSTSPCATSSPNEILEKLPTELDSSRSLPDLGRDPFLNSGVDRIDAGISEEQELIGEPFGCKDRTLKSGDQSNSKSVNSTSLFRESTHHEDTKIKTEPEQSRDEFLGVKLKTESPKCQIKLEIKEDRVIKEDAVDDAKLGKSESLNLGINKLKEEKSVNETQKHEKPKEKKNEKEQFEGKKNVSKPKLEDTSVPKKNKRKVKERKERKESEKGFHLKKAVETSSSNHSNITKPLNKEVEDSDKKDRLTFDTHSDDAEEEESLIDVVGDESPVVKKKKRKEEGLKREKRNDANGHTKNGYSDIPLDIQVVRDDDKEPKSLLVRIDLSLLQRIPKKAVGNDEIAVSKPT